MGGACPGESGANAQPDYRRTWLRQLSSDAPRACADMRGGVTVHDRLFSTPMWDLAEGLGLVPHLFDNIVGG